MNKLYEAQMSWPGAQQAVGYGKNYHTQDPNPITWENLPGLEHFLTATADGKFLAGFNLPGTDQSTPVFQFENEEEAMLWLRNTADRYRVEMTNHQEY